MSPNRLRKSSRDRVLFGVAGGLAEHFDVDSTLVRLVFILTIFAGGLGVITYLALALLMPQPESTSSRPQEIVGENIRNIRQETEDAARRVGEAVHHTTPEGVVGEPQPPAAASTRDRRHTFLAAALIIIGVIFLLANLGLFRWIEWRILWPVALILVGVAIIMGRLRKA